MSESKHTPGPWMITRDQRSPCAIESTKEPGPAIALVYLTDPETKKRDPEFAANARLIAAAPELLEALEIAERILIDCDDRDELCTEDVAELRNIRVAIAKAKGTL